MPAVEGTDVNEAVQENEQMEMAPVAPNPYGVQSSLYSVLSGSTVV